MDASTSVAKTIIKLEACYKAFFIAHKLLYICNNNGILMQAGSYCELLRTMLRVIKIIQWVARWAWRTKQRT